jgi:hypothetical protein
MQRRRESDKGLVTWLLLIKRLIGIGAVLGVFYYTVPWTLIRGLSKGESLTIAEFMTTMTAWATGLVNNILLVVLLLFIAVLTYGPEVLDLVGGQDGSNSPPGPRF